MKTFSHEIALPLSAGDAFPLFTPRGEESWVPGWKPRYLDPPGGQTRKGMVFTTGHGGEETIWTCLDLDEVSFHARYFRAVPGSRVSIVEVRCLPEDRDHCATRVSYSHVALSEAGERFIEAITQEGYAAEIDDWARMIAASRARQRTGNMAPHER